MGFGKFLKLLGITFGVIMFIVAGVIGYGYYMFDSSLMPEKQPFEYAAHYINPDTALLNDGFKVCDDTYIAQYYNTPASPYPNGKNGFRTYINSNYENRNYSDSGYLNIRFIINCEGDTGRFVIHENNLDLEPKTFNKDLVDQLFKLTSELKDWKPTILREDPKDAYMYVSYRIEHGEIVEIIP
ncbi:hypothetical protein [Sediminibacter sp. Hel_I_10]|uniref:hypothetical protein n=1 Tax=Sediminibacter sp. Hel_I_10 TaxID=1392490 RepID=UPI00047A5498|nr:hypothetical protein [Sediminibacter sp. Hel_I_10]